MIDLNKYKQEQILRYINELNNLEKDNLLNQIKDIDFDLVNDVYNSSFIDEKYDSNLVNNLKIIREIDDKEINKYISCGENIIKNNEYAIVLLSGGFGSRLGLNKPKGCLELNIKNTKKSLFEIFIDKLKNANKKYNTNINLYIMTSKENNKMVQDYFKDNNYFDYDNITFFKQDNFPILDLKGKIVLKDKSNILFGPNGNGDVFNALKRNNILDDMNNKKIKYILFSTIDNVLIKLVDPLFIGATICNNYELSSKTIDNTDMNLKDWIFCKYNNKPCMISPEKLDVNIINKKDKEGNYLYNQKNIACHLISIDLLNIFSNKELKYHRVFRHNVFLDENNTLTSNNEKNSYKFEKFIFDAFIYANDMLLYRTTDEEFCPIKVESDIKKVEEIFEKMNINDII